MFTSSNSCWGYLRIANAYTPCRRISNPTKRRLITHDIRFLYEWLNMTFPLCQDYTARELLWFHFAQFLHLLKFMFPELSYCLQQFLRRLINNQCLFSICHIQYIWPCKGTNKWGENKILFEFSRTQVPSTKSEVRISEEKTKKKFKKTCTIQK